MWRDTMFRRARSFSRTRSSNRSRRPVGCIRRRRRSATASRSSPTSSTGPTRPAPPRHLSPVTRPKPWPVVFYVHGGAFHLLSKDTHWLMGLVFARFGYLVVNISYRLAPKHPFPAAIEDTCRAYTWMASRIRELGGDPNRVAVAGESAGGNLITSLALASIWERQEPWAREVFECGVLPRAAMPFCAMLQVSETDRFCEAPQDAVVGRRNDPRCRRVVPAWASADAERRDRARRSTAARSNRAALGDLAFERPAAAVLRARRYARSAARRHAPSRKSARRAQCRRAKRDITRAAFMHFTRLSGIPRRAVAGVTRSHSSIATCGSAS